MKKSFLKLGLVGIIVSGSFISVAAAEIVSTTNGASSATAQTGVNVKHLTNDVNEEDSVDYVQASKYTTSEIESGVKTLSVNTLNVLNELKDVLNMKKNPVDGKVSTDDRDVIGSMTHIRANVTEMDRLLGVDKATFSEKDRKAIEELEKTKAALETQIVELENKIADVDKKIPVAEGIKLGAITIPVLGISKLQVFPIMEGEQMVGSVRTRCGAYLKEDQLQNFKSVNYCVATVWSNSATRVSDQQTVATVDTYFVGRSESYVPGEVNSVTINWDTAPKTTPVGFLKYYNISDKKSLDTLSYENTVTAGDGFKYAGKDAAVE